MDIKSSEVVETGLVVHLELSTEALHRSINGYIANVGGGGMGVEVPQGEEISAHFSDGVDLLISASREGVGLVGRTKVLDRIRENDRVIKIAVPDRWVQVQRREDYRVDVALGGAKLTIQNESGTVERALAVELTNLSAGGAVVRVPKNVPTSADAPELRFRLDFGLDMQDPLGDKRAWEVLWSGSGVARTDLSLTCQILALLPDPGGSESTRLARCHFGLEFSRTGDLIREFLNQYERVQKMRADE